jgi:hypothetical protein
MTEILASLLVNTLLRKGFERVDTHHTMLWFTVQGRRTSIHTPYKHPHVDQPRAKEAG